MKDKNTTPEPELTLLGVLAETHDAIKHARQAAVRLHHHTEQRAKVPDAEKAEVVAVLKHGIGSAFKGLVNAAAKAGVTLEECEAAVDAARKAPATAEK